MPNTYLKQEKYAALSVAALNVKATLPMVFTRFNGDALKGARDDTVAVFKTPGITTARDYEWRTRTEPIKLDRIARTQTTIKLGEHVVSAVPVTDEEMTLDVTNFAQEVVSPQTNAVVDRLNGKVLTALKTKANFKVTDLDASATDDPYDKALDWSATLDEQGTPEDGRTLLVGSNVKKWIMKSETLLKYDLSQANTAYRRAKFGTIANMDVVSSQLLGPNDIYVVHPSALVVANIAPLVPNDGGYGATLTSDGWSIRVIRRFEGAWLQTVSTLSTFVGVEPVLDELEMEKDDQGIPRPKLDAEGEPVYTGKNVRGASGTFTPAA